MLLNHRSHCVCLFSQRDQCRLGEHFPNRKKVLSRYQSRFLLLLPDSLNWGFKWFFPNLVPVEGNGRCKNPVEIMMRWVYRNGGWKVSGRTKNRTWVDGKCKTLARATWRTSAGRRSTTISQLADATPPQKKEINCNLFDLFLLLIKKMLKMCGCFTLFISLVPKTSEYNKIYPLQFPSMKPDFFQTPKQLSLPKYLE